MANVQHAGRYGTGRRERRGREAVFYGTVGYAAPTSSTFPAPPPTRNVRHHSVVVPHTARCDETPRPRATVTSPTVVRFANAFFARRPRTKQVCVARTRAQIAGGSPFTSSYAGEAKV